MSKAKKPLERLILSLTEDYEKLKSWRAVSLLPQYNGVSHTTLSEIHQTRNISANMAKKLGVRQTPINLNRKLSNMSDYEIMVAFYLRS